MVTALYRRYRPETFAELIGQSQVSMVLAAIVLLSSNPKLARSAAIQGLAPLIGVVLLAIGAAQSGA